MGLSEVLLGLLAILISAPSLYLLLARRDAIRLTFLALTLSQSLWILAALLPEEISSGEIFGEWAFLLTGPLLLRLAHLYPGRTAFIRFAKSERRRPFNMAYSLVWVAAILLAISFIFLKEGMLWINRIFALTAILLAIREQRFFLKARHQDPRKAYSRYFIITLLLLLLGGLFLFLSDELNLLDSYFITPAFLFAGSFALSVIISYRAVALRDILYRNAILLFTTSLLILPLFFLISYLLAGLFTSSLTELTLVLCALFILFQQIHVRISPFIFNFLFQRQARADEVLREYRQSIGNLRVASVEADLLKLLDQLHAPRIFIAYRKGLNDFNQAREFTRLAQAEVFPPASLERELVAFLKERGSGLIFDLQNIARNLGNVAVFQELSLFSSLGVEFVLTIGHTDPLQVIMAGLARDAHPFDHTDLEQLLSVEVATALALRNHSLLESVETLKQRLEEENRRISTQLNRSLPDLPAAGKSAAFVYSPDGPMARVLAELERFAQEQNPLLLVGETGTGKEQLARFVHMNSSRPGQWVAINCSAIPPDLLENELFGHERGAYTGATEARSGLVERANNGTLFLDEIGEMPQNGQAKLLRLIQEGEYEKLGGSGIQKSTARLIFATNRNLETEVASGSFREDLYYRISTFEVRIPPLRDRREDIALLLDHFLMIFCQQMNRELVSLALDARDMLINYSWPGNVRELENLILRMLVLTDRRVLEPADLPVFFSESFNFSQKKEKLSRLAREQEKLEKELLLEALEQTSGNQREAAKMLDISRGSLQYRMKTHGLSN